MHDADGQPVDGAIVQAVASAAPGLPWLAASILQSGFRVVAKAKTNPRGRFVLRVPGTAIFGVYAENGAAWRSAVATEVAPGSQLTLTLRPVRAVRGRFVEQGEAKETPIAGALIRSFGPVVGARRRRFGLVDEVRTDADGVFTVRVFPGARSSIENERFGVALTSKKFTVSEEPIVLRRPRRAVRCTVVDGKTGKPLPMARMHVAGRTVRAGQKGVIEASIRRSADLDFEAPGYAYRRMPMMLVPEFKVELTPTGQARMRFVDDKRKPWANGEVCLLRIAHHSAGSGPAVHRDWTDAKGQLFVNRPAKHRVAIFAKVAGRYLWIADVEPGTKSVDLGDIPTTSHTLSGTVRGPGGTPAPHVPVYGGPVDGGFGSRLPIRGWGPLAFTDHAGRFRIDGLARRNFEFAVRTTTSYPTFSGSVAVHRVDAIELKLRPAPLVKGRVVDDQGQPLSDQLVWVSRFMQMKDPKILRFGMWSNFARTDADGRFAVGSIVPDDDHRVSVGGRSGFLTPKWQKVYPPTDDVEFRMTRRK